MLFDTHTHIDQIDDIDAALKEAKAAGVVAIAALSTDLLSSRKNLEIKSSHVTDEYPEIHLGMGIHPGVVKQEEIDPCIDLMKSSLDDLSIVGEIGLDFWYPWVRKDETAKALQREAFQKMIVFAGENGLPVSVHSRGKWQECFDIVNDSGIGKAVFHWYSGPLNVLEKIIDKGFFISVTPSLAYSDESRRAALNAPIEQTMLETDCPVFYGKRGEGNGFKAAPKDVFRTLRLYAELKGIEEEKAMNILFRNSERFFNKNTEN
jgi:TatD DNase family protein